jgi:DHA1 family multidrug resistance protein-like MFS transporter
MEIWRRNLIVLWVGTVFGGMAFSIVSPFLPTLLEQVGAIDNLEVWSGWAFAASFYTSALLAPVWGTLADKYGRKPQMVRAGVGIGVTYMLMAFANSPIQIVGLRLLLGIFNGFVPTAVAMVATNTPEEHLGGALGTIQTGSAFGTVIGPLVGGLLSHYLGIQTTLLIAGSSMFFATLVSVTGTTEVNKGDRSLEIKIVDNVVTVLRQPLLLQMYLLIMVYNLSFQVIQPILPLFIEKLTGAGNVEVATGLIFSLAGMATVLAAPRWGRRGQKVGYTVVLRNGFLGAAILSFALVFSPNLYYLGGMRFAFGLFMAAVLPSANALISRAVSPGFRSRALSVAHSFQQIGGAIGPVIGGYVGALFGLPMVFAVTGVLLGGLTWWLQKKQWDHPSAQPGARASAGPSVSS